MPAQTTAAEKTRSFGTALRLLRRRARLTQAELGIAVGYSDAQICRLERGRRPPDLTTLVALFLPALRIDPRSAEAHELLALAAQDVVPETTFEMATPASPALRPATTLVGRERERRLVAARLREPGVRLLTLLGPPGVGKTHLARQISEDMAQQYANGAHFIELVAASDAAEMALMLGAALGLVDVSDAAALGAALATRHMLLVLDNVEQIRGAAGLVRHLLGAAPGLTLLATSRVALGLAAETTFGLPPLQLPNLAALPPIDALAQVESVALLLARLRVHTPQLELTDENALALAAICVRVDGLPLAIELVAAHGRLFTPQELLVEVAHHFLHLRRRSQDLPLRQQSLTDALAWSYAQLSPSAQVLFERLSLFVGGWTVEAALAVCAAPAQNRSDLLADLQTLLDHSLIQRHIHGERSRLTMLAMVRAYAQARWHERGESVVLHQRALNYFITMAEGAERQLQYGSQQAVATAQLEAEQDNLRTALRWAQASGAHEAGLRLAGALWRFWYTRGYLREGRQWLETFLHLSAGETPQTRAHALDGAGILAWRQSDYDQAERWFQTALTLFRSAGERLGEARVLGHLGMLANDQGSPDVAISYYEASLPLHRALDDQAGAVAVLHNLGNLHCQQNRNERATQLYAECLTLYNELDDQSGVALIALGLGIIARDEGDRERALASFSQSLALARQIGDDWNAATALINLGDVAADDGAFDQARRYLHEALEVFETMGDQQSLCTVQLRLAAVELLAGQTPASRGRFRQGLMLANGIGFQHGIAEGLEGLAACASTQRPLVALQLLAAAERIRSAIGMPIALADAARYERTQAIIRQAIDSDAWHRSWTAGQALEPHQAVALALANG